MAAKKSGLGRGLDSLIPNKTVAEGKLTSRTGGKAANKPSAVKKRNGRKQESDLESEKLTKTAAKRKAKEKQAGEGVELVNIQKVEPNREQPRKRFNEDSLEELAESIRQFGVLSPLLVQERDDYYEIIAGERRWRAAKIAGLKEVPVIIRNLSEQEIVEIALIENIQREDLNPIEEAEAYKRLLDEFHLKQDQVAERVSKSRTAVTNSMRLLKLDPRVQQMVIDEMISTGHARAILGLGNKDLQFDLAQKAFDQKMSVRDVEREVRRLQKPVSRKSETQKALTEQMMAVYQTMEENLKNSLGTKVRICPRDHQKGKLEIEYYSQDELQRIMDLIQLRKQ